MVNQTLLVSTNTRLHVVYVTSQHHIDFVTIIAIQCDSLCTNCRFLKTGVVDHIGVLPIKELYHTQLLFTFKASNIRLGFVNTRTKKTNFHFPY